MNKIIAAIVFMFLLVGTANAGEIARIYADMDAKIMSSNVNVYNYYSPDAVIVETDTGGFYTVESARDEMQKAIRRGVKVDIYQSENKGMREIRTGFTNKLCAVIVFSKDYSKLTADDPKNPEKKITIEQVRMTTRVFNTINPQKWVITSEHSSLLPNETKINGIPVVKN